MGVKAAQNSEKQDQGKIKVSDLIKETPKLNINDFEASLTKQNNESSYPPSPTKPATQAQ